MKYLNDLSKSKNQLDKEREKEKNNKEFMDKLMERRTKKAILDEHQINFNKNNLQTNFFSFGNDITEEFDESKILKEKELEQHPNLGANKINIKPQNKGFERDSESSDKS